MELFVIGTGSQGNCYLLTHGEYTLILDCGVPIRQIYLQMRKDQKYACLVTHEHNDHAKAVSDLFRAGVTVYASKGCIDAMGLAESPIHAYRAVKHGEQFSVGCFTIKAFAVEHDAAEPLGFLIRCIPTGETVLYATDTASLRYKFPPIDYWLVECNYTSEALKRQYAGGFIDGQRMRRLQYSHMSLEGLVDVLKANDLTQAKMIVLLHMSWERANEAEMVSTIERLTDARVIAADNMMEIPLQEIPF